MTLQSSGSMSVDQINVELGKPSGASITIPQTDVVALIGKSTSIVIPDDFYGKTWRPIIWSGSTNLGPGAISSTLNLYSSGEWNATWAFSMSGGGDGGTWTSVSTPDATQVSWTHVSGTAPTGGVPQNTPVTLSSGSFTVSCGNAVCRIRLNFIRGGATVGTQTLYLRS